MFDVFLIFKLQIIHLTIENVLFSLRLVCKRFHGIIEGNPKLSFPFWMGIFFQGIEG